jgi:ribonuclease HI
VAWPPPQGWKEQLIQQWENRLEDDGQRQDAEAEAAAPNPASLQADRRVGRRQARGAGHGQDGHVHQRDRRPRVNDAEPVVELFTDGACAPNPGAGGWGLVLRFGGHEKEMHGSEVATTNNRMEMMAAIKGLELLTRPSVVHVHTDSEYLRKGMTQWVPAWKRNGWMTKQNKPVKNADLWALLDAATQRHQVNWFWVKGHAGHPDNERADKLAVQGAQEAAEVAANDPGARTRSDI